DVKRLLRPGRARSAGGHGRGPVDQGSPASRTRPGLYSGRPPRSERADSAGGLRPGLGAAAATDIQPPPPPPGRGPAVAFDPIPAAGYPPPAMALPTTRPPLVSAAGLARGVLLGHLLLSPLVFTTATLELFEYPKVALLRLAALGLTGLGLAALA